MSCDDVTTEVVVTGDRCSSRGRVTVLRLRWNRADPLAVDLHLSARPDHPALPRGRWAVLRDFLRYGLEVQTGDGDVRIVPDPANDTVVLHLVRAGRPCQIALPRRTVSDFLDATEAVVPSGEEASDEAVEALIARLLSD